MSDEKTHNEPFVSIVICTHNRKETLQKYILKSIPSLNYSNYEVVIIDDVSTDGTEELISQYKNKIKNLKYIKNLKHKTFCHTRNLGIKHSSGEIIVYTDDDCTVDVNWLKDLTEPYIKDNEVMIVGGKSYIGDTDEIYNPADKIFGCNMSFRKSILKKFIFDTFMKYSQIADEVELIWRIQAKGYKSINLDCAIVKHYLTPTDYRKKEITNYLNRIYVHTKIIFLLKYYLTFIYTFVLKNKKTILPQKQGIPLYHYLSLRHYNVGFNIISDKYHEKSTPLSFKIKILYILLFEIPIKSKIKRLIDETRCRIY